MSGHWPILPGAAGASRTRQKPNKRGSGTPEEVSRTASLSGASNFLQGGGFRLAEK